MLLLLPLSLLSAEPQPAKQADPASVRRLIAQLGSSQFTEREAATKALEALGPAVLEALREAARSDDAEIRRRARPLIQKAEKRLEAEKLLQPTRVRLVYQDTPLAEALADFSRRTGLPLRLDGDKAPAGRKVALDTGDTTFWQAVDLLCHKAALVERDPASGLTGQYSTSGERRIYATEEYGGLPGTGLPAPLFLKEGKPPSLPTYQAGALRLRVLPVFLGEGERVLPLEVKLEPRLRLLTVLAVRVEKAVDDQGQRLIQPSPSVGKDSAVPGGTAEEIIVYWDGVSELPSDGFGDGRPVPVRLRLAERPSKRLTEVHGVIALQVQTPAEPLAVVDNPLKAAGKTAKGSDGSSLKVAEVKRDEEGELRLRVQVTSPPRDLILDGVPARIVLRGPRGRGLPPAPEGLAQSLTLVDARGQKVPLASSEGQAINPSGTSWEMTLVYPVDKDQTEPARLIYTERRTIRIEVPFVLKDVPLP
jgi:hypothetical protein